MNLLTALFLIVFKAVPDALYDRGYKTLSKSIRLLYTASVFVVVFAWRTNYLPAVKSDAYFWRVFSGAILLYFALFDLIYNLMKKNPVFYIGSTDPVDVLLGWFFRITHIPSGHFLAMLKFICLLIGLTWLVR